MSVTSEKEPDEKICFEVTWEDKLAGLMRRFNLNFYPKEESVEMVDLKFKKIFLKKTKTSHITLKDLFIGNTVVLFSRSLKIVNYGDEFTRNNLSNSSESTFALIKPDGFGQIGLILRSLEEAEFTLARAKMVQLGRHQAEYLYKNYREHPNYNENVENLSGGRCVALELVRNNAINCLKDVRVTLCQSDENTDNDILFASNNAEEAENAITFFFPKSRLKAQSPMTPASFYVPDSVNTSCCIVRPHLFKKAGLVIQDIISAGFTISALETFRLDFGNSDEFLDVYKGVIDNYGELVNELSSGPILVMQIFENCSDDIVQRFRQFCGPCDPNLAKALRPTTLRAKYGDDKTRNGVHCTDLPEDGHLEVEYFFKIMQ